MKHSSKILLLSILCIGTHAMASESSSGGELAKLELEQRYVKLRADTAQGVLSLEASLRIAAERNDTLRMRRILRELDLMKYNLEVMRTKFLRIAINWNDLENLEFRINASDSDTKEAAEAKLFSFTKGNTWGYLVKADKINKVASFKISESVINLISVLLKGENLIKDGKLKQVLVVSENGTDKPIARDIKFDDDGCFIVFSKTDLRIQITFDDGSIQNIDPRWLLGKEGFSSSTGKFVKLEDQPVEELSPGPMIDERHPGHY